MQIYGPAHLHGSQAISAPHHVRAADASPPASGAGPIRDELDLSDAASLIDRIAELPDIRADRVAQLRQEIASGRYESDDKLDLALERLLDEIG